MKKKEKKRVLLFLGICCFILVGILVFLIVGNISALNKASKNAKPWKELYHCVDMRIGNYDDADLTQMKRYYSVLKSNPYIYAALSENERDFFTADKSVLYNNLYSYERIVNAQKKTITFEVIGLIIFLVGGVALIYVYKNKQTKEINKKQTNSTLPEIVDFKNNSTTVFQKKENIDELKKFEALLDEQNKDEEKYLNKKSINRKLSIPTIIFAIIFLANYLFLLFLYFTKFQTGRNFLSYPCFAWFHNGGYYNGGHTEDLVFLLIGSALAVLILVFCLSMKSKIIEIGLAVYSIINAINLFYGIYAINSLEHMMSSNTNTIEMTLTALMILSLILLFISLVLIISEKSKKILFVVVNLIVYISSVIGLYMFAFSTFKYFPFDLFSVLIIYVFPAIVFSALTIMGTLYYLDNKKMKMATKK